MTDAPICPTCKKRPRVKAISPNAQKTYQAYCSECHSKKQLLYKKKKRDAINSTSCRIEDHLLCPICEQRKIHPHLKFCESCHNDRRSTQPLIWYQIYSKLKILNEYIENNAEFPPEITTNTKIDLLIEVDQFAEFIKDIKEGIKDG